MYFSFCNATHLSALVSLQDLPLTQRLRHALNTILEPVVREEVVSQHRLVRAGALHQQADPLASPEAVATLLGSLEEHVSQACRQLACEVVAPTGQGSGSCLSHIQEDRCWDRVPSLQVRGARARAVCGLACLVAAHPDVHPASTRRTCTNSCDWLDAMQWHLGCLST